MKNTIKTIIVAAIASLSLGLATSANAQDTTIAKGTFVGKSDHVTTGGASIQKTADGYVVVLAKDFSLDGAPDPKVGLGKDGYSTKLAKLSKKTGAQTYKIPADIDVTQFNEIWIWCEKFDVPLGLAKLK